MLGVLPRVAFLGFLLTTTVTAAALAEMAPWAASRLTGADDAPFDVAPLKVVDGYGHHDGARFTSVTLSFARGLTGQDVNVAGLALMPVRDGDGSLEEDRLNDDDLARRTIPVAWDGDEPLVLTLETISGVRMLVELDAGTSTQSHERLGIRVRFA